MCSLKNFQRISTYFFNYRLSSLFLIFPNSNRTPCLRFPVRFRCLFPRHPSSVPVSPFAVFQPICVDQNTEAASEKRASDLPLPSFFALFLSLHLARLSAQFPRFVCGFSHSRAIPLSLYRRRSLAHSYFARGTRGEKENFPDGFLVQSSLF